MWIKTVIIQGIISTVLTQFVGEQCKSNRGAANGICSLVKDCDVALRSVVETGRHNLKRCGFAGLEEIVCCVGTGQDRFGLQTTSTTSTTSPHRVTGPKISKRIADRECEKIKEAVIPPLDLHIIGGDIASNGEFPHMAALGFERDDGYNFDCGGSLISPEYVLTAAHCVDNLEKIEPSIVRVGVVELGGKQFKRDTDIRISRIIKHPKYTRQEKYNDIALLRLERSIEYTPTLGPACLYTSSEEPRGELTITGWGQTNTSRDVRSNMLLKANVTLVPREECSEHYRGQIPWRKLLRGVIDDQICAGDSEGRTDTCQGDSGGPLQGQTSDDGLYRIIGITSFGRGCATKTPGVYTRVSHYLDWIESVVWPNSS